MLKEVNIVMSCPGPAQKAFEVTGYTDNESDYCKHRTHNDCPHARNHQWF